MAVKKKTYDFRCRTLANVSGARRMRRPRSWRTEIARSGTAMSESRTDAYGYNVRNELTSATKLGGPASVPAMDGTAPVPPVKALREAHDALRAKLLPQVYSLGFLNPDVEYFK